MGPGLLPGQAVPATCFRFLELILVQALGSQKEAGLADPQKQRCHYNGNLAAFQSCVCDENIETGSLVTQVLENTPARASHGIRPGQSFFIRVLEPGGFTFSLDMEYTPAGPWCSLWFKR